MSYPFLGLLLLREGPSLMSGKLRINNSLKQLLFNIVTVGQQAKHCGSKVRYFYQEFDSIFLFLRVVVNIPLQTLIFSA